MTLKSEVPKLKGFLSLPFLRDLALVTLLVVIGLKLVNAELKIDLSAFSFNDFLALVLALFSVALSVAFYFKANDASNQFYDNTYKFTKDMSEILGRIEAGFGERLRHLDEGYSGMRERLDNLPHYGASSSDVQKEKEEIKIKEAEQRQVIEDLASRAQLAEHEKRALFENLSQKSEELEQARIELRRMQSSRRSADSEMIGVIQYVARIIKKIIPEDAKNRKFSIGSMNRLFKDHITEFAPAALEDMRRFEYLDSDDDLTSEGAFLLRQEITRS